jgi:hypothetical protein
MTHTPQTAWLPWEPSRAEPWNHRAAAHLLRRAGFGGNWRELEAAVAAGPGSTVKKLVAARAPGGFEDEMQRLTSAMLASGNARQLAVGWLYRMLHTPAPLVEKLTLFWHGHFATSADKVTDAALMHTQKELVRSATCCTASPAIRRCCCTSIRRRTRSRTPTKTSPAR